MTTIKCFQNPHKVLPQFMAAMVAAWSFLLTGTVRAWSSTSLPSLEKSANFEISPIDLSWIASVPPLCALVGSLVASVPLQYFGRRKTLMIVSPLFMLAFLLMGFTYVGQHKSMLYIGRGMCGFLVGVATPASQIYISECSSARVRGRLSSLSAISLALGILVTYTIGAFVQWYVLSFILAGFPLILLTGMFFMPETPVWLHSNRQEDRARKSLQRLRGRRTQVDAEFQQLELHQMINNEEEEGQQMKQSLKSWHVLHPLVVSVALMVFHETTGVNAVVFYTVSIFASAGSELDGRYATIIIGVVQFICTLVSAFVVDRLGRRILLMCSSAGVSISLASMGTFFYLQHQWSESDIASINWMPLLSLVLYFVAYSAGFASVPFILMGELFPARYRALCSSIASSVNLLCAFIVVLTFPNMQTAMGTYGTFWFFMSCTLVSMLFVYFFLPETKGRTLHQIEDIFRTKTLLQTNASKSTVNV